MNKPIAFPVVALGALFATGCSSAWRQENREQEMWWDMAETGNPRPRDPFTCLGTLPCAGFASRIVLEEACAKDDPASCFRLGQALLLDSFGSAVIADARRFLERGCGLGWEKARPDQPNDALQACTLLGIARLVGLNGFPKDAAGGAALLGERCKMDDALACAYYGYAHEFGLGVAADIQRAVRDYEAACSALDDGFEDDASSAPAQHVWEPFACLRLGFLADQHVIDVTPEFSAQLFAAVCFHATATTGTWQRQPDGRGIGRVACPIAAERFLENGYTYRELRAAKDVFRQGYGQRSVEADAEGLLKNGCEDGDPTSCKQLLGMFEESEARGEIFDLR